MAQQFKNPLDLAKQITITNAGDPNAAAPIIEQKPQRFTHSPRLNDYGLSYEEGPWKEYEDAYYYHKPKDVDEELAYIKGKLNEKPDDDFYLKRQRILSNPDLQRYLRDNAAFNKQVTKDYDEYYPTAKQAILNKLLGQEDLYKNEKWDHQNEGWSVTDDLYDAINADFNKKYGYDGSYGGDDWFSPIRKHGSLFSALDDEEKDELGKRTGRRRYNKENYIAELLRTGELTLNDLRALLGGKQYGRPI